MLNDSAAKVGVSSLIWRRHSPGGRHETRPAFSIPPPHPHLERDLFLIIGAVRAWWDGLFGRVCVCVWESVVCVCVCVRVGAVRYLRV